MSVDEPLFPRLPRGERCNASVLLLSMPWGIVDRPPISLAVLKSSLRQHGISADIHYPYLNFAARIGFDVYARIETLSLLGEWLFSPHVFAAHEFGPNGRPDFLSHLEDLGAQKDVFLPLLENGPDPQNPLERSLGHDFREQISRMEAEIPRFLEETLHWVLEHPAPIIGFTSTFIQILPSAALARRIKEARPESVIVFGGASFDGEMGPAFHRAFPWVDYIATGEADDSFPQLVRRLLAGERPRDLPGFSWSDGRSVIANPPAPPPHFPAEAPPLDYDEYFEEANFLAETLGVRIPLRYLPYEIARGCWWGERSHCTFCGLNDHTLKFRAKPSSRVLRELSHLARRHRLLHFGLSDDILDATQIEKIAPALKEADFQPSFYCQTKVGMTRDQIRLFSEVGIHRMWLGIETLHTPLLKRMAKGTTRLQNLQALKWCQEFGIHVSWNLLWGIPGETEADYHSMSALVPSLFHLTPPEQHIRLEIHRFSPYHQNPGAYGLKNLRPKREYTFCYPPGRIDYDRIAYQFESECDTVLPRNSPVAQNFRHQLDLWSRLDHAVRGSLSWTRGPGYVQVLDARSPGPARALFLQGVAGEAYLFCDSIRSLRSVTELISRETGRPARPEDVESLLQSLVDLRIMAREDHQFLGLALPGNRFRPGVHTDLSRTLEVRFEERAAEPAREPAPLPG